MRRTIAAIIVGLATWMVVVTVLNWGLRLWLPGYAHAEPALLFTFAMKIGRLSIAVLACLATGAVVRAIAPASELSPWIVGLVLLALFLPEHVRLWARFPVWYHLTFLLTVAPLVALGGRLGRRVGSPTGASMRAPQESPTR